jgi:hypothetical protein
VIDCWLSVREFSSRDRRDSFASLPGRSGTPRAAYPIGTKDLSPSVTRLDRKVGYSLASSAEIKNSCSFTSAHLTGRNDVSLKYTDSFALFKYSILPF